MCTLPVSLFIVLAIPVHLVLSPDLETESLLSPTAARHLLRRRHLLLHIRTPRDVEDVLGVSCVLLGLQTLSGVLALAQRELLCSC